MSETTDNKEIKGSDNNTTPDSIPEVTDKAVAPDVIPEFSDESHNSKSTGTAEKKVKTPSRDAAPVDYKTIIKDGLWDKNPALAQLLGMCSTLAVTTTIKNGLALGLCTMAVLVFSNIFISLVRRFIPKQIRIASFIVIISSFVTVVELVMKAYFPDLNKSLGLFIPLIVVNCIILARAEAFASRNPVLPSAVDGIFMGLGFTFALCVMSFIRELVGNGSILDIRVLPEGYIPTLIFLTPAGAFITLGVVIAFFSVFKKKD